jgi:hypothetical protein
LIPNKRKSNTDPRGRGRGREMTVMDLEAMDADVDGNVDWSEFMLVAMNKVDLWDLRYQFDTYWMWTIRVSCPNKTR